LTGKKDEKSLTSHCPVVSTILTQPYLATKFYGAANPDIQAVFEEQLKRLQTDYFDFYLLHGMDENFISDYMDKDKD
jgi:predicted aldo/keto reductase-like oxidoreductase